jgi:alkylation response protein AidB-like acyl-CoA dehydrogenase
MSEYRGGSDVLGMETRAERRGDEWIINGTKAYITNAPYAELIIENSSLLTHHFFL